MSQQPQPPDTQVRIARIGAASAIIAALIGGLFLLVSKIIPSPPTPTPQIITSPTASPTSLPSPVLAHHTVASKSATVIQMALPWSVTAKHLMVVAITQWEGEVLSVADTSNDAFIRINTGDTAPHANPSHDYVELYYAKIVRSGKTTVTVDFSTAGTSKEPNDENVGIYEYSGLDTTNPLDQAAFSASYGNYLDGGALHSTTNNELCFVVGIDDNGHNVKPTAGNGYTLEDQQSNSDDERFYTEDQIVGAGSFQTDFSIAAPSAWAVIGVLFRPA